MDPEAIRDIFQSLGAVQVRRMFGGHGVSRDGLTFALAFDGELYLKADAETHEVFRALGSRPFSYEKQTGEVTVMSYWLMPDEALEDPDEAARLARLALDAARRDHARKGAKKAPRRKSPTARKKRATSPS